MSLIPVMVYIHGGGLMSGSGAIPTQVIIEFFIFLIFHK